MQVICGASAGACIAAYVCVRTDAELADALSPAKRQELCDAFQCFDPPGMISRAYNWLTRGHMFDPFEWSVGACEDDRGRDGLRR
jgi:predicted acylesterase/phospholipase RssA